MLLHNHFSSNGLLIPWRLLKKAGRVPLPTCVWQTAFPVTARLRGDLAKRRTVANANIHQASHVDSDQSVQREAVRINRNIHTAAEQRENEPADQSPKMVVSAVICPHL